MSRTFSLGPDRVGLLCRVPFHSVQIEADSSVANGLIRLGLMRTRSRRISTTTIDCEPRIVHHEPPARGIAALDVSAQTAPRSTVRFNVGARRCAVSEARLPSYQRAPPHERARNRSACNHAAARKGRPAAIPQTGAATSAEHADASSPPSSLRGFIAADSNEVWRLWGAQRGSRFWLAISAPAQLARESVGRCSGHVAPRPQSCGPERAVASRKHHRPVHLQAGVS